MRLQLFGPSLSQFVVFLVVTVLMAPASLYSAEAPSMQLALQFRPVQKDVEYETPNASEYKQCRVKVERQAKASGWVVIGAAGQVLRRYIDTNGDNVVDQWRYYNHGLEVYRDVDTNFNNKVDESRWLNTGGTRWGSDTNEDGQIDSWKMLSAEEATRVAVGAFITGDTAGLQTVLLNTTDVRELGIGEQYSAKLLAATQDTASKIKAALRSSRSVTSQSKWMQFECSMPNIIPVDDGKADRDLTVYENVMVIVRTGNKTAFVQIGEMIRVGDVWKLTQIPTPLEGESVQVTAGGVLMQPALFTANGTASSSTDNVSPEIQRLLEQLQTIDRKSPPATASQSVIGAYNSQRTQILSKLISVAKTEEERSQWTRQMVDGLATAVQTTGYAPGLEQLQAMEKRATPESALKAYITYRRMLAEYSLGIQQGNAKEQTSIQQNWQRQLEQFVKDYPKSEDSSEAMLQLATSEEFHGKTLEAQNWYGQIVQNHAKSRAAVRAAGALRRLGLQGKALGLSGPGLNGGTIDISQQRGRVVLVYYWATWCKPCTEDLPQIRALYEQYHARGFEVIGVNLDTTDDAIRAFLAQQRINWPQIFQPGGLDSPPAKAFGIISLPTMFLVDKSGAVISRNVSVADLKAQLAELLK